MESARGNRLLAANPRVRAAAALAVLLAVGALFSLTNISLVRAAGASISVAAVNAALPATDPFSPLWNGATVADIPLSAQQMYQPGGGSVQAVQVRALHNDTQIAFLVSWADSTRNDYVKDLPSDAGAIQLPIDPTKLPYQCMGQSTSRVNIWQWKAALERVAQQTGQAHNGTRNLTSDGMGKIADTDGVLPTATSTWRNNRWYVIYSRALAAGDEGTAPLTAGLATDAAFAVWDGAKGETRSMKAVSTWIPLQIPAGPVNGAAPFLVMAVAALAALAVIVLAWRMIPH